MKASVSKGCKITPVDDGEKRFCDDCSKHTARLLCVRFLSCFCQDCSMVLMFVLLLVWCRPGSGGYEGDEDHEGNEKCPCSSKE